MSAFPGLLTLSLQGAAAAVLIGAALSLAERCRVEVPPFLRHALWLVVFVRLLVPVLPASPLGLPPVAHSLERAGGALLPGLDLARLAAADGEPSAEAAASTTPGAATAWPWNAAAIVWALGLLAVTARWGVREVRLRRRLRDAAPVTDRLVLATLDEARRRAGVGAEVPVLESRRIAAPALHGTLRPRILLPAGAAEALGGAALSHALLHELVHVRRRDGATRLLARLAAAVHWFNPAAWYALRRLEAECELACDAAVLARLGERERIGYGRTLLHAATLGSPGSGNVDGGFERAVTALPLSTHQTLKRRIQMIARYRSPSRTRLATLCLAALVLAAVALTDAPLSAGPAPAPQAPETAEPNQQARSKRTLEAMRDNGTAMFSWITDALIESGAVTREQAMAGDLGRDDGEPANEGEANPTHIAWSDCPAIGYDEARALLVPTYIEELPRTDGWGHELELCLDRTPADSERWIAGIRSPGRDGTFEGDTYPTGPFAASDLDRDVVWIDGFFITWPSAEADG